MHSEVFKLYIMFYKSKIIKIVFLKYFGMIKFSKCYGALMCLKSRKQHAYKNAMNRFTYYFYIHNKKLIRSYILFFITKKLEK